MAGSAQLGGRGCPIGPARSLGLPPEHAATERLQQSYAQRSVHLWWSIAAENPDRPKGGHDEREQVIRSAVCYAVDGLDLRPTSPHLWFVLGVAVTRWVRVGARVRQDLVQVPNPNPSPECVVGPGGRGCVCLFSVSIWPVAFFCFPPGISLTAKRCPRPKCAENPVSRDVPPVGVRSARTGEVKKMRSFRGEPFGAADPPPPQKCP